MDIIFQYDRFISEPNSKSFKLVDPIVEVIESIIEDNDTYYYIKEEKEKFSEIVRMPSYIKEDWMRYNREELTTKHVDDIIKKIEVEHNKEQVKYSYNIPYRVDLEEKIQKLRSVRRDLVLRKI
jgi:hypothetical protein